MIAARPAGPGFRPFRVAAKVRESRIITSFHLEPVDPAHWRPWRPGQFLVLRLPAGDGGAPILRNYSLSGPPDAQGRYRITVKREPASAPGHAEGRGSNHLHDRVAEGDLIEVEGPRGDFVLDEASDRPVLLVSGGVGLTPMVAMLHRLAERGDRRVLFLHGCEDGEVHALRDEVAELASRRAGLGAHVVYRNPTPGDLAAGRMNGRGIIDRALLQSLLCLDDYEVYLCGPPAFMQALYTLLRGLGVAENRIAYEFFGPATVLKAGATPPTAPPAAPPSVPVAAPQGRAPDVEFRASGRRAAWDGGTASLLDLAEGQGLEPAFSCRAGICGSCAVPLLSGEIEYFEEPLDQPAEGQILLCCSRPLGPVVLDI